MHGAVHAADEMPENSHPVQLLLTSDPGLFHHEGHGKWSLISLPSGATIYRFLYDPLGRILSTLE
jgi:hypothetical protein